MSNSIQVIEQRVVMDRDFRIYGTFDEPLFLARDVAEWIEYDVNRVNEMVSLVDESEKLTTTIPWSGQNRKMWFLTEDGLYEVLMQSRKPIAKQFKAQVKQILKDLRRGKTAIVPMTEYQRMSAEAKLSNARYRKARELLRLAERYQGQTYAQILESYATRELTGEHLLPLPQLQEKTYTATEIGEKLGITANKVGILTNQYNLKTEEYGAWFNDKAKGHSKEVQSFRYYDKVIPVLRSIIEQTA